MGTHIIAQSALREFWARHAETEEALRAWHHVIETGEFSSTAEILAVFANARSIGGSRMIFNILGNQYRLVVQFRFDRGRAYIRFVGTHEAYDRIDATTI